MAFSFEGLSVYQKALTWAGTAQAIGRTLKGKASVSTADQLSRTAFHVAFKIAEGCGSWKRPERRHCFWTARRTLFECVSITQILKTCNAIEESAYAEAYGQLEELVRLVNGLIQTVETIPRKKAGKLIPNRPEQQASVASS